MALPLSPEHTIKKHTDGADLLTRRFLLFGHSKITWTGFGNSTTLCARSASFTCKEVGYIAEHWHFCSRGAQGANAAWRERD